MKPSTTLLSLSASALISNVMSGDAKETRAIKPFDTCPSDVDFSKVELEDPSGKFYTSVIGCPESAAQAKKLESGRGAVLQKCDCLATEFRSEKQKIECSEICYYTLPEVGFACPIDEAKYMPNWNVDNQCQEGDDCVVTKLNPTLEDFLANPKEKRANVVCGPFSTPTPAPTDDKKYTPAPTPAPTQPPSCHGGYAYDNKLYCKCPAPKRAGKRFEVSVCGDATYLLPEGVQPCTGPTTSDTPVHNGCPKKDDIATRHCRKEVLSYLTQGKKGDCQAPQDATCEKLNTGAWGCIFPGNCNTVNTCLEKAICEGDYKKKADGSCVVGKNGYTVATEKNTATVNTADLAPLPKGTNLKTDTGAASAVAMTSMVIMATMAGAFILA